MEDYFVRCTYMCMYVCIVSVVNENNIKYTYVYWGKTH
jgi:hypothetical protein